MFKRLLFVVFTLTLHMSAETCATFVASPGCKDIDPDGTTIAEFCAYTYDSFGIPQPARQENVEFLAAARQFSGYHTHFNDGVSAALRPMPQMNPEKGRTNALGCVSTRISMSGWAGAYRFYAVSNTAGAYAIDASAHYMPANPLLNAVPLAANPAFVTFDGDLYHQSNHLWLDARSNIAFSTFALYISAVNGRRLNIKRCSLADGGGADNYRGSNWLGDSGRWQLSAPLFEGHATMNECDVENPSADDFDPEYKAFYHMADIAALHKISLGLFQPNTGFPVTLDFWKNERINHLVAAHTLVHFLPPIILQ